MSRIIFLLNAMLFFSCCSSQEISLITQQIEVLDKEQPEPSNIVTPLGKEFTINVRNQKQFDEVNEKILTAVKSGEKNIIVKYKKGVYRFKENHISLQGLLKQNCSIRFVGKQAILTSYDNIHDSEIEPWMEMAEADDLIKIIDKEKKICFIPLKNDFSQEKRESITSVQVTQWYWTTIYDVLNVDSNGILFYAHDLTIETRCSNKGYNVNSDYLYCGKIPRFRLYDRRYPYTGKASCFLNIQNTEGITVDLSGIRFNGNKNGDGLIILNQLKTKQIYIHNCVFENIHSIVAAVTTTENVTFDHNLIKNIDRSGLHFTNGCSNVRITNNVFDNCGKNLGQTFCVNCGEANYYIADNIFRDFGYSAIGVGIWHGNKKSLSSSGIIENNELYFTPTYFKNVWKYTIMDSGAIYTWTQNDKVIIRRNYIHDYVGMGDNRGIFCDDGSSNIKIIGNLILNIPNSYCIDLRRVKDHKNSSFNNANNIMAYNIVDGPLRFMGYFEGEERQNFKLTNYIMQKKSGIKAINKYENLMINESDVVIACEVPSSQRILVNKNELGILKSAPSYQGLEKYLIRKVRKVSK